MIIAIIPARGGSKRISLKNIKPFGGRPMIAYSIQVARESGLFDRIIVSTDSEEIARVAESLGAEVPFKRPIHLADDFTATAPVLIHSLKWLDKHGDAGRYFCCIHATAPFLRSEYIQKGFDLLREKNAISAFSVTTFPSPIFRALKVTETGRLKMIWPEYINARSQDLPEAYHDAGQFYWADTKKFLQEKRFLSKDAVPVVLPRYLVQDIDTIDDWESAERMYLALEKNPRATQCRNGFLANTIMR